jgi:hypothetical protein
MAPEHVLVLHYANTFIVNVQPSFPAAAASVRVEHFNRIVPAACGLAVVVKHPIKLVVHRFYKFPGMWRHDFWTGGATRDSQLLLTRGKMNEKFVPSGISSSGVK